MRTQQEHADAWRNRWADKEVERPHCYNRADWPDIWFEGCPMWREGGNAHKTPKFVGFGGKLLSWTNCNGCKQKR